jgi:hypothetical protein
MATFIAHPWAPVRVGDFLASGFQDPNWTEFRAAVAFVKRSGTRFIAPHLSTFCKRPGAKVNISIGVDLTGSTYEGVKDLVDAVGALGKLWVYRNSSNTFHPKVFVFRNGNAADIVVGSGNLTKGGLYENSEAFVRHVLDLSKAEDAALLGAIEASLDNWSTFQAKLCLPLDSAVLKELHDSGDLPSEAVAAAAIKKALAVVKKPKGKTLFGTAPFPKAPAPPAPLPPAPASPAPTAVPASGGLPSPSAPTPGVLAAKGHIFGMTLQNTDVGVGQTTSGTQKRSPEVFIPLLALDQLPTFWNWKSKSEPTSSYKKDAAWQAKHADWIAKQSKLKTLDRPIEKLDWENVRIGLLGQAGMLEARIWFNPIKKDIRIRHEALRSAGAIGDILLVRRAPSGSGRDFDMQVVKTADAAYAATLAKLTTKVPNSPKRIGYF